MSITAENSNADKLLQTDGKWRLNEVTKAQRELFEALGVNIQ